jgi:hypothetical protein
LRLSLALGPPAAALPKITWELRNPIHADDIAMDKYKKQDNGF